MKREKRFLDLRHGFEWNSENKMKYIHSYTFFALKISKSIYKMFSKNRFLHSVARFKVCNGPRQHTEIICTFININNEKTSKNLPSIVDNNLLWFHFRRHVSHRILYSWTQNINKMTYFPCSKWLNAQEKAQRYLFLMGFANRKYIYPWMFRISQNVQNFAWVFSKWKHLKSF